MRLLPAVLLILTTTSAARAQTLPQWAIQVLHREERLRDQRLRGATELTVLRPWGRGAIQADLQWIDEPARASVGMGAELYVPLWRYAEGRVRLFSAPRAWSAPDLLAAAEITQHLGGGWQLSVSADHRAYDRGRVNVALVGAGWSNESWYVRARGGAVRSDDATLATGELLARRASTDRRRQLQISATAGGEIFDFADPSTTAPLLTGRSTKAAVQLRHPVTRMLSVIAGAGVGDYRRFGTRAHVEAGIALMAGARESR